MCVGVVDEWYFVEIMWVYCGCCDCVIFVFMVGELVVEVEVEVVVVGWKCEFGFFVDDL